MKIMFVEAFKEAAPKGAPYDKWSNCVHKVGDHGGPYNPYAVCGASVKRTECECGKDDGKFPHQEVFEKHHEESIAATSAPALTRAGSNG